MPLTRLIQIISEKSKTDINEISSESLLLEDLGIDSLTMLKILTTIEEEVDFELPFDEIKEITTVNELLQVINQ
jgi:acyl carrier protein